MAGMEARFTACLPGAPGRTACSGLRGGGGRGIEFTGGAGGSCERTRSKRDGVATDGAIDPARRGESPLHHDRGPRQRTRKNS